MIQSAAGSFDAVLAIDVMPYIHRAGPELIETHFAEAARVLRAGGDLVILNLSYRGDLESDRQDVNRLGSTATLPGDITPGTVTQADYDVWKENFGQVFPPASLASITQVPEPSAWMLLLSAIALTCLSRSHAPRGNACPAAPRP